MCEMNHQAELMVEISRIMAKWQQLSVAATFTDNVTRDVTRLTVFSSSDPSIADVTPNGLVEFMRGGEVAMAVTLLRQGTIKRVMTVELGKLLEHMSVFTHEGQLPDPGFVEDVVEICRYPNLAEHRLDHQLQRADRGVVHRMVRVDQLLERLDLRAAAP